MARLKQALAQVLPAKWEGVRASRIESLVGLWTGAPVTVPELRSDDPVPVLEVHSNKKTGERWRTLENGYDESVARHATSMVAPEAWMGRV